MRSKLVRVGGVAIGLLALLGALTPPAHATTVLAAAFVGSANLSGPLSYPCFGPGPTVGTDLLLCPDRAVNLHILNGDIDPTLLTHPPLPLPGGDPIPNPPFWPEFHHNTRTILSFPFVLCVAGEVNVNKPGKALTNTSTGCTAIPTAGTLPNTVSGNCGLSSGQVTALFNLLTQTYKIDIHFVALGGLLVVEGHSTKMPGGTNGLVLGLINATPPNAVTGGGSCLNKTATTFTIEGVVVGLGNF